MAVVLTTLMEALDFIDSFDGWGMIVMDEDLQIERLRVFDLIDDYPEKETPRAEFDTAGDNDNNIPVKSEKLLFERLCEEKKVDIINFAKNLVQEGENRHCEDLWSEFNSEIDVQVCRCDDSESPNYDSFEVWAYSITELENGKRNENTIDGVLVTVL